MSTCTNDVFSQLQRAPRSLTRPQRGMHRDRSRDPGSPRPRKHPERASPLGLESSRRCAKFKLRRRLHHNTRESTSSTANPSGILLQHTTRFEQKLHGRQIAGRQGQTVPPTSSADNRVRTFREILRDNDVALLLQLIREGSSVQPADSQTGAPWVAGARSMSRLKRVAGMLNSSACCRCGAITSRPCVATIA